MSDLPDFYAGGADVILRPEWAAKEGTDKTFLAGGSSIAPGSSTYSYYQVPAGKSLFITQFGAEAWAHDSANADHNQIVGVVLFVSTGVLSAFGGNGGGLAVPGTPTAIPAGITIYCIIRNHSDHDIDANVFMSGYEVEV